MKQEHIYLALLLGGGLTAASFALPNNSEYVTMLLRDGHHESALVQLETMYRNGHRSPYNVKKMIELYIRYGREKEVGPIIASYLKKNPNDEGVNDFKLWLFELEGKDQEYLSYLEALTDRTLSKKYMKKLLEKYRIKGLMKQEVRVLEKYRPKNILAAYDYERLAAIYADHNDSHKALDAYRDMDGLKESNNPTFTKARLVMFRLLLEKGLVQEAMTRGTKWINKTSPDKLVSGLMEELDYYDRLDLALTIGEKAISFNSEKVFVVAQVLNHKKQFPLSRTLLKRWKTSTPHLTNKQIRHYVSASISANDTPAVLHYMAQRGIYNIPPKTLILLAEEFVYQRQYSLLNTIRPFLPNEITKENPLLAAKIALLDGEKDQAAELIDYIEPSMLKTYEYEAWIEIMVKLKGEVAVFYSLKEFNERQELPKGFIKHYASLAKNLGKRTEYKTVTNPFDR